MKNGLVVSGSGHKFWYKDGKLDREDGPAIEYTNGSKLWYKNRELHREDGPAIEWNDGNRGWYIHGKKLTETEFKLWQIKNRKDKLINLGF